MKIFTISAFLAIFLSFFIYYMMQSNLDILPASTMSSCYPTNAGIEAEVTTPIYDLFNSSSWPARWTCGNWTSIQGWTSILSDIVIFLSYFGIPLGLLFVLKQSNLKEVTLKKLLILFTLFIVSCGLTHLIDASLFWVPVYNLSIAMKFFTAIISGTTFIILLQSTPELLNFKSPQQLKKIIKEQTQVLKDKNIILEYEVEERRKTEAKLQNALQINRNLYKENQHRMKNNLQMISGLLFIRASEQSEEVQKDFTDIAERVSSISKVNELLLQLNPDEEAEVDAYFEEMQRELKNIYHQSSPNVLCNIPKKLKIPASQVMLCGLIFTEFFSNSVKHAFKGIESPTINIDFKSFANQGFEMKISDNGIGFNTSERKKGNFGLGIIRNLAAQLNANQELVSIPNQGTTLIIHFK